MPAIIPLFHHSYLYGILLRWFLSIALRILYCAYGVLLFTNWSDLHCKYGVSRSYKLKQFSKHVREAVNDPYSLWISAHSENMANFVISIYDNRDRQVRWWFTLKPLTQGCKLWFWKQRLEKRWVDVVLSWVIFHKLYKKVHLKTRTMVLYS